MRRVVPLPVQVAVEVVFLETGMILIVAYVMRIRMQLVAMLEPGIMLQCAMETIIVILVSSVLRKVAGVPHPLIIIACVNVSISKSCFDRLISAFPQCAPNYACCRTIP